MVKRLAEHPLARQSDTRHLKTIVYGGGPMYLADLLNAQKVFGYKLAQIYGQGESPMTITVLSKVRHADTEHAHYRRRLNSAGIPFAGIEVQVAGADADDNPLPSGEIGEVLVRGATVMAGYWQNPQATAETLRNGWLHTGDLGYIDADGFLTLTDRSKDMIISGGTNIYPREIEEVLLRHPAVREVGVVGAADAEWGERVVAFIVINEGVEADSAGLDDFCQQHMARFKRPKEYRFVESLPKNNYGKVLKTTLREWL
jgi:long-chain acyl-CoA synthetase